MQRLALSLVLMSAAFLSGVSLAVLPERAQAFDVDNTTATNPDGTPRFSDPDEAAMPGPWQMQMAPTGGSGNPADNGVMIPSPQGDMPFWTYSGAPAQRFR